MHGVSAIGKLAGANVDPLVGQMRSVDVSPTDGQSLQRSVTQVVLRAIRSAHPRRIHDAEARLGPLLRRGLVDPTRILLQEQVGGEVLKMVVVVALVKDAVVADVCALDQVPAFGTVIDVLVDLASLLPFQLKAPGAGVPNRIGKAEDMVSRAITVDDPVEVKVRWLERAQVRVERRTCPGRSGSIT